MMNVLDMITTAGGMTANEDRVGCRGNLAWVIDGATDLYDDAALPANSDTQWLVDIVCQELTQHGSAGYQGSSDALLAEIASYVSEQQVHHGFPSDRTPPACSIAVALDHGSTCEITRVGDATAVLTGAKATVLATDYFDQREQNAVRDADGEGQSPEQVRAKMLERRLHTMTSNDTESVFSGHPQRTLCPHTIVEDWQAVEQILLCTDGFTRLVTDYALYPDWPEAVRVACLRGLASLEKEIRLVEDNPTAPLGRRFKRSDDVAALLIDHEDNAW